MSGRRRKAVGQGCLRLLTGLRTAWLCRYFHCLWAHARALGPRNHLGPLPPCQTDGIAPSVRPHAINCMPAIAPARATAPPQPLPPPGATAAEEALAAPAGHAHCMVLVDVRAPAILNMKHIPPRHAASENPPGQEARAGWQGRDEGDWGRGQKDMRPEQSRGRTANKHRGSFAPYVGMDGTEVWWWWPYCMRPSRSLAASTHGGSGSARPANDCVHHPSRKCRQPQAVVGPLLMISCNIVCAWGGRHRTLTFALYAAADGPRALKRLSHGILSTCPVLDARHPRRCPYQAAPAATGTLDTSPLCCCCCSLLLLPAPGGPRPPTHPHPSLSLQTPPALKRQGAVNAKATHICPVPTLPREFALETHGGGGHTDTPVTAHTTARTPAYLRRPAYLGNTTQLLSSIGHRGPPTGPPPPPPSTSTLGRSHTSPGSPEHSTGFSAAALARAGRRRADEKRGQKAHRGKGARLSARSHTHTHRTRTHAHTQAALSRAALRLIRAAATAQHAEQQPSSASRSISPSIPRLPAAAPQRKSPRPRSAVASSVCASQQLSRDDQGQARTICRSRFFIRRPQAHPASSTTTYLSILKLEHFLLFLFLASRRFSRRQYSCSTQSGHQARLSGFGLRQEHTYRCSAPSSSRNTPPSPVCPYALCPCKSPPPSPEILAHRESPHPYGPHTPTHTHPLTAALPHDWTSPPLLRLLPQPLFTDLICLHRESRISTCRFDTEQQPLYAPELSSPEEKKHKE
ncbi:hypothetical protein DFH27DRAFT_526848 [Peziza echinospora]|nr:hypothetical protein DFH27DRAFT_526848 [Peziza echinospora]